MFTASQIAPILRRARDLTREFEARPETFDWRQWRAFKTDLLTFVRTNTRDVYDRFIVNFVEERALTPEDIPDIFPAILERYQNTWVQSLNRAFAFAEDTLERGDRGQSILQRLFRRLRAAAGLSNRGYREGGTVTHHGQRYWLRMIQDQVASKPVSMVDTSRLTWILRHDRPDPRRVAIARTGAPLIVLQEGERLTVIDGLHRVAKALQEGTRILPVRFVTSQEMRNAKVEVAGFQRVAGNRPMRIRLVPYLEMLFKTIPRNMERDLVRWRIRLFDPRPLFRVVGGIVENSAFTCRWANGRVFTEDGLRFLTDSPILKDHLFHPNCRHRLVSVSHQYRGSVWTQADIARRVSGGRIS